MQLLLSGVITSEQTAQTGAFSINDYVLERENMRPFIEQCFMLKAGQTGIAKNFGKYYVVQVIERGVKLAGYEDESAVIRSQVLKEKKSEYVDNWLKKERDKAHIQIKL